MSACFTGAPTFLTSLSTDFHSDLPRSEEPFQKEAFSSTRRWRTQVLRKKLDLLYLLLAVSSTTHRTKLDEAIRQLSVEQQDSEVDTVLFSPCFQMLRSCNWVPPWGHIRMLGCSMTSACRRPIGMSVDEEESGGKKRRFASFTPVSFVLNRIP